ncbi:hypothetical protein HZA76_02070 [Candidatus Roizmanbacteria bacterium]|nr:hypothetical protein [Candidatus Roizmanbacteria bacterium]
MTFSIILLIFLVWKTLDTWTLFLAPKVIPYLGFFPYGRELYDFGLPHLSSALANFDGIHYLLIAHRGNYVTWEQAYFPLYPLLMRFLTPVFFNNELITGMIISSVSFFIGLMIFLKLFRSKFWLLIFLLVFPTSFFFSAIYTEGLFFLLLTLTLFFLKKENYQVVILLAILSALTKLVGVFLIIPIIFHLVGKPQFRRELKWKNLILVLSPFIGLGIYCLYLIKTTGNPLMFITSQPVFGANRSTNLIFLPQVIWRYLKIFITASHTWQYYVSIFEFLVFGFVLTILIIDLFKHLKFTENFKLKIENYDRLGLNIFSFANILLPTLTGTLSSVPRYALFSLSLFIFLSEIRNKWIKIVIAVVFLAFHIFALGFFGQGYFIS